MGSLEVGPGQELGDDSVGDELKGGDNQHDADQEERPGADVLAEAEFHPSQIRQNQASQRRLGPEQRNRQGADEYEIKQARDLNRA